MIKNESKIIKRCLDSIINICDSICITDTGSTDDTLFLIKDYFKDKKIPYIIFNDTWSNFGLNRTNSYNNANIFSDILKKNIFGDIYTNYYGLLLDADMILESKKFDNIQKNSLKHNGYTIMQYNNSIIYSNIRIIKLYSNWKCIGLTHEYWDGNDVSSLTFENIAINDIGDGGSKNDKYERDIKLLSDGIKLEPNNSRYYFYLAQSYKDNKNYLESIKYYKMRIKMGGWDEEIYISYLNISEAYILLGDIVRFEKYALLGYNFRPSRSETIYLLCTVFRQLNQNLKSMHYYNIGANISPTNDILFVKRLEGKFEIEYILNNYKIYGNNIEGLKFLINYTNKFNNIDFFNNYLQYYIQKLDFKYKSLGINKINNFNPSSPSICKFKNNYIMNIRLVNYEIIHNDNGHNYSFDGDSVITKNIYVYYNDNLGIITKPVLINNTSNQNNQNNHIKGFEDIRLFEYKDEIHFFASTCDYNNNNIINIIHGIYDITNSIYTNIKVINTGNTCEKNWTPINDNNNNILVIYKWYPYTLCKLNDDKLYLIKEINMPIFFKNIRGSSTLCQIDNKYYCLVHGVNIISGKRKYYHVVIVLNNDYTPIKYSIPFYFDNYNIEYCMSLLYNELTSECQFIISKDDKNPSVYSINIETLNNNLINI